MQRTQHSLELGKAAVQRFCPERQFDAKIPAGGTLADRIDAAIAPVKPALDAHIARLTRRARRPSRCTGRASIAEFSDDIGWPFTR
jgi:hypothetical protein